MALDKRDLRDIGRAFRRVMFQKRVKAGVLTALIIWVKGLIVIAEMLVILSALYYFNMWMQSLSAKSQMRVIWGLVIGFIVIVVPLVLGSMASIISKVLDYVKKVIK